MGYVGRTGLPHWWHAEGLRSSLSRHSPSGWGWWWGQQWGRCLCRSLLVLTAQSPSSPDSAFSGSPPTEPSEPTKELSEHLFLSCAKTEPWSGGGRWL